MLNRLYKDRLTVSREVKGIDKYGKATTEPKVVCKNIPCRLSQIRLNSTTIGIINKSTNTYKLFVQADVDIKQNDNLEVIKGGITYKFKANKPIKYTDFIPHQELIVEEVEDNRN